MASKSQNKPPLVASHGKFRGDEVTAGKMRRIGSTKMSSGTLARPQTRQAFSVVNGGQDPAPNSRPASNSSSDSGVIEFTKEDVEALLSEKPGSKNKFNYNFKEKKEQMDDYIKRLKQCVRWFRQLEGNYVTKQENLRNLLEVAEKKCSDVELLMKEKENELNSIIIELQQNLDTLQEKHTKLELDKSEALDSLAREKESKLAAEKVQASLLEELKRTQEDNASNIQKIQSLNDMYKRLQEYNTSLQQYNSRLQSELHETHETLKHVEKEKAAIVENLSTLRGRYSSLQEQLAISRDLQNEAIKQKEALASEVTSLRSDLLRIRDDRDQQLSQVQNLSTEVVKYQECAGKSSAKLHIFTTKMKVNLLVSNGAN